MFDRAPVPAFSSFFSRVVLPIPGTCLCSRVLAVAIIALLCALTHSAHAGGLGSVVVTQHSDVSITVSWTDPDGIDYRKCGNEDYKFKVKTGNIFKGIVTYEFCCPTTRPYTIPLTLKPSTEYKITVFVKAEKKNWWGRWKNCEFRKVGTVVQTTDAEPTVSDNVSITDTGPQVIQVTATIADVGQYDMIRVAYKKTFSIWTLNNTAKFRDKPSTEWVMSDERRGWLDVEPAYSPTVVSFGSLRDCRAYEVVAYGFAPGATIGTKIGEARGKTGAACKTDDLAQLVVDDHEDVMMDYVDRVASFYGERCSTIFGAVSTGWPQILGDFPIPADGDSLDTGYDTFAYLVEERPSVYGSWQLDPDLRAAGLDLPHFLQQFYPDLLAALWDETFEGTSSVPEDRRNRKTLLVQQNTPNPLATGTVISFSLAQPEVVTVRVFDLAGRPVRTLLPPTLLDTGPGRVSWDGRSENGQPVAAGLYFYEIQAGVASERRKMLVLR